VSDEMEKLRKLNGELSAIVSALRKAPQILDLDLLEKSTLLSIKEKANKELQICKLKLAPFRKERKAKKKQEKAAANTAKQKGSEGMRLINKKIKENREKIHKISKMNQTKARFIQGGSPGLGKKS
jgi:hypothetical protein